MIRIPLFYRMRVAEYLTYTARVSRLINEAITESITLEPFKSRIEDSKTRLEESGKKVNTQLLTINVTDCDARRDQSMIAFEAFVGACSKRLNPAICESGKVIHNEIKSYGSGITRRPMLEESAIISALLSKIESNQYLSDCLQTIRGKAWMEELKEAENEFNIAVEARRNAKLDRTEEQSGEVCKEIRKEFESFFKYLDVMCEMNVDPAYSTLVREINIVSEETNAIVSQRMGRSYSEEKEEI